MQLRLENQESEEPRLISSSGMRAVPQRLEALVRAIDDVGIAPVEQSEDKVGEPEWRTMRTSKITQWPAGVESANGIEPGD